MFTTRRIKSTIKPELFQSLNNGVWYYNYDIIEEVTTTFDLESEEEVELTEYSFILVRISGTPTVAKCYDTILKQLKDENNISLYDAKQLGTASENLLEDIYYNIRVDFGEEVEMTALEKALKDITRKIDEYDTSNEVNSFYLNGIQVWLSKDIRVGLMNSLTIEKTSGKESSTLWFGNICVVVNCDAAIQMLSALELYALECYNKTAEHKVNISKLTTEEEVLSYDYTTGYPEKLSFNI